MDDFVDWARSRAVAIDDDSPPDALAALDPLVDGKRLAFLGEANHFVHEKYAFRLRLLRYLAVRGFTLVGEELSWSDGQLVDRYLDTGDERWLERVSAYGRVAQRPDGRDDTPTGLLGESWNVERPGFREEQVRFDRGLRALGLRLFGFDADYHPAIGYELLLEWSGRADLSDFDVVEGESLEEEYLRLTKAVAALEAQTDDAALLRCARTLRDSHHYAALTYPAPTYDALRPGMARREDLMEEHVEHALAMHPDERLALMSHCLHLARDDDAIETGAGVGPGGGIAHSLGHRLSHRYRDSVFSVWMLEGEGHDSQPIRNLTQQVTAPRGTLNHLLSEVGDSFVLPVGAGAHDALTRPMPVRMMYGSTARVAIADQVDALYFGRYVSPLRADG